MANRAHERAVSEATKWYLQTCYASNIVALSRILKRIRRFTV